MSSQPSTNPSLEQAILTVYQAAKNKKISYTELFKIEHLKDSLDVIANNVHYSDKEMRNKTGLTIAAIKHLMATVHKTNLLLQQQIKLEKTKKPILALEGLPVESAIMSQTQQLSSEIKKLEQGLAQQNNLDFLGSIDSKQSQVKKNDKKLRVAMTVYQLFNKCQKKIAYEYKEKALSQ